MSVACVMMQKDEDLVLDAWMRYYSYILGYENVFVFDNGSTNPVVIETLKKYERLGVTVDWSRNKVEDFHNKGNIATDLFREWQSSKKYSIMIPLDCDEFLAVMTPSDIRCDKSSILNELRWFIGTPHTIGIKMEFRNSYRYKDYFYMLDCNKTVFSGGEICAIDHGFHTAGTKTREIINSRLCHIHLHNKPYRRLMKDTRQKLQALGVDTSDPGAIASTQHSWHLLEYFKKSEHDILREIDQHAHIHIPGFGRLIDDLGASLSFAHELDCGSPPPLVVPTPFDHEAYLDRYADVRWSGLSPLYHGLAYGAKERRIMDRLMESTPDMESGMKEEALELPA